MDEEQDTRPTSSPYASDVCAVYFQGGGPLYISRQLLYQSTKIASRNTAEDFASSSRDLHFDDISLDTGHPQEAIVEKKHASELATALRVYVATDTLDLPTLRDLARKEIVRLGGKLGLPGMIKVMEDSNFSFDAVPGIATYIESRILSFSVPFIFVDHVLAELGPPNTLSEVLLRSVILKMSSEKAKKQQPTFVESVNHKAGLARTSLVWRPTEEAMKLAEEQAEERAEQQAIREAEEIALASEAAELKALRSKRALKGRFTSREKRRLSVLQENATRRAQAQAAHEAEGVAAAFSEDDNFKINTLRRAGEEKSFSSELDRRCAEILASSTMKIAKEKTQRHLGLDMSPMTQNLDEAEYDHFSDVTSKVTPSSSQASLS
ncbi:hypothetical protein FSARC_4846 [Fusarium sarcochroum]|uniref:Uncharacterized protein n=1 Tax=Fusarium sarcochroum TaxID=1208366 RepID=A0A8H4XB35_9HYPO|nr:hypothetical protein FSARC_4846 [Fusarium sarcochroum]